MLVKNLLNGRTPCCLVCEVMEPENNPGRGDCELGNHVQVSCLKNFGDVVACYEPLSSNRIYFGIIQDCQDICWVTFLTFFWEVVHVENFHENRLFHRNA